MKISLTLTEAQGRVLVTATDLLARVLSGQFDIIKELFLNQEISGPDADAALKALKSAIFHNQLSPTGHLSIHADALDEEAKVAWDIKQVVRHAIAWSNHPEGGWTVDFDPPMQTATEPLPTAEVKKETLSAKD